MANWYVLFRLNPVDFEKVYEDAIIIQKRPYQELLEFIFGTTEENKHDSFGVWPESNLYFKNFKRIIIN